MPRRIQVYFAEGVEADGLRLMTAADLRRLCEYIGDHPDCGKKSGRHPMYHVEFSHPPCMVTYLFGSPNATKLLMLAMEEPPSSGQKLLQVSAGAAKWIWELIKILASK